MCPNGSKIRTQDIGSLTEYVCNITQNCEAENVLFRGQPDGEELLPKIGRASGPSNPLQVEKKLLKEIEWRGGPFLEFEPRNTLEWLQVGRHHGMSTRLLDWTFSALAALWFTVAETRKRKDGAIWVFNYDESDVLEGKEKIRQITRAENLPDGIPEDDKRRKGVDTLKDITDLNQIQRTCVLIPRHIDRRIAAQASCFTLHAYEKCFTPLEEDGLHRQKLRKLVVKRGCFGSIRRQLHLLGMNQSTLYPDVGGLCAHLDWFHRRPHGSGAAAQSGCT